MKTFRWKAARICFYWSLGGMFAAILILGIISDGMIVLLLERDIMNPILLGMALILALPFALGWWLGRAVWNRKLNPVIAGLIIYLLSLVLSIFISVAVGIQLFGGPLIPSQFWVVTVDTALKLMMVAVIPGIVIGGMMGAHLGGILSKMLHQSD